MKKFIRNVLLFSIVFFVVEKLFYFFLFISPSLEVDRRLENLLEGNINKDLVIFGSSRGARDLIAHQIEDSLNLSAFNLSYPGSNIEFHEFLLESLLKYNTSPKAVLLTVDDPVEFISNESLGFRFDRMYPLAKYNYINNELIEREEKNVLSRFLVLARFNQSNLNILQKRFNTVDSIQVCGSMPISFQKENIKFNYGKIDHYSLNEENEVLINAFERFQKLCLTNDIDLHIVFPPNFKAHNPDFERRIKELSDKKVHHYIYSNSTSQYSDSDYYHDATHLNKDGAVLFTNQVIEYLRNYYSN
ncbi:hypothetical protein DZC72_14315 [Maribacter algicola]|uniref:SGNH/GDSL hydrolase family protein n=1 Tax=Maribacter algicola TaxID=2498892 RepID=A0A426RIL7_9FLAO|nr:hypothetical protein [Maribacter algicola]RRQ48837.1 hypothetical protein DZC72_14315 [Maribacter algicola]